MRLPYAPTTPPPSAPPSTTSTYAAITARRAPRPLQPLDLALLHSPALAAGWNAFLGAVRSATALPHAAVQEVAVCRVAVLTRAPYEWDAHSKLAVAGDGAVGREGMETILRTEEFVGDGAAGRVRGLVARGGEGGLSARQWVVVAYTDQMTRCVQVDDEIWGMVEAEFGARGAVELTATVAAYNCVSRFLGALDVGERNGGEMTVPEGAK